MSSLISNHNNTLKRADGAWALLFGFTPLLLSWLYKEFINPRPFWGYFDHFETLYYSTGINLVESLSSTHADNPAGPLQLISAALVFLVGADPEDYPRFLFLAHTLVLASLFAGCWLLIRYLFADQDFYTKTSGICVFFLAAESVQYTHYWGPESLFFIFGVVYFILFIRLMSANRQVSLLTVFLTSIILGVCVAQKFVFLVWLPAFALALITRVYGDNSKTRMMMLLSTAAAGFACGFVLVTFFLWQRYPYMFDWLLGLITRDGPYGKGQTAPIELNQALLNWSNYIRSAKLWFALMLVCMAVIIMDLLRMNHGNKKKLAVLVFIGCVVISSFLAITRQMNLRYLLPMGLTGILIFYLVCQTQVYRHKIVRVGLFVIVFCLMLKHIFFDAQVHNIRIEASEGLKHRTEDILKELPGYENLVVVYSFRFPTASFALRQHQHNEQRQLKIDKYYPKEGHFIPYVEQVYYRLPTGHKDWDVLVIRSRDLHKFPDPIGRIYKQIDGYSIVLSPNIDFQKS